MSTVNVDIIDKSVPESKPIKIAIIGKPNPVTNEPVTGEQMLQLIQFPQYWITDSATGDVINGGNIYEYFPELKPGGGGGGGGDTSRYSVAKTTDASGEVTYRLMQTINGGTTTAVGEIIGLRGNQMLVNYGSSLTILDTAIADIKEHIDASYNFTTFTELGIDTHNKNLKTITDELHALNLPTNTIVTGQLYSTALPFSGNGEAEVMINKPAYWWKCTSLNVAPYSWSAIAGGGSWSGVIMDWTPTYNNNAEDINYDNTTSGAVATNVQSALDEVFSTLGDVNTVLEGVL